MPVNTLFAWADLARTLGEVWYASAEVVAFRMTRMATAGAAPSAGDRAEFARMTQEKFDAASESARGMAAHMTTANLQAGARAFRHFVTGNAALYALMTSRTMGQTVTRHAALVRNLSQSAQSAAELSHATVKLARHGIEPIRARATANAKRLRGR